jgi:hypothetical protein
LFLKQKTPKYVNSAIQKKIIINRTQKFLFLNNFKFKNLSFFKFKKMDRSYYFNFKKNINNYANLFSKNFCFKNSINFYFYGFNNVLKSGILLSNFKNNFFLFFHI